MQSNLKKEESKKGTRNYWC